jgi:hypothetical protein
MCDIASMKNSFLKYVKMRRQQENEEVEMDEIREKEKQDRIG